MIDIEDVCEPEWVEWDQMTPQQRWAESEKLRETYRALGGTLDPKPDTQSPFFDEHAPSEVSVDGRSSMRFIRRSGV